MPKRGYHHGNLRQALVDAALELIEVRGPTGFTLSEAAKQAGVTPAAVYRHFEGREDLIAEAARQGVYPLREANGEGDGTVVLQGSGVANAFVEEAGRFGFRPGGVFPAFGMAEVAIGGSFPARGVGLQTDDVDRIVLETSRVAKPVEVEGLAKPAAAGVQFPASSLARSAGGPNFPGRSKRRRSPDSPGQQAEENGAI